MKKKNIKHVFFLHTNRKKWTVLITEEKLVYERLRSNWIENLFMNYGQREIKKKTNVSRVLIKQAVSYRPYR